MGYIYIYIHTQPQPLCDMMEYLNMNIRISPIDIEDIICKNPSYIRYDWKLAENTLIFCKIYI